MKEINYLAVTVSAIISTAAGFAWYMIIFRAPYMADLGRTKAQLDMGPSGLVATIYQVIGNFVMAFVLAWLMHKLNYMTPVDGLKFAAIMWVGFVAAVIGPMYAYEAFSFRFFLITTGYVLLSLLISGAIIGTWK